MYQSGTRLGNSYGDDHSLYYTRKKVRGGAEAHLILDRNTTKVERNLQHPDLTRNKQADTLSHLLLISRNLLTQGL